MLGVVNSNYAGLYGISINPSAMVSNRLYMDYNLVSFQGYLDNNYIFISRDDFYNLLSDKKAPVYYTEENELRNYNIYRDDSDKFGYQNIRIFGPGGMLVYGQHAFGLTSAFRSVTSFQDLPNDIGVFLYEAIDYEYQHDIQYLHDAKIRLGSMSWYEMAISYAYNFHRYKWNYWSVGISIKPLIGTAGFYSTINNVEYIVHNDDSASVYNATFEYGASLPVNYSTNDIQPVFKPRGFGFGLDAGITYQNTEQGHSTTVFSRICEQPYEEYNFRIGLSILDFGYIKFKKNAVYESYINASAEWYKPHDTLSNSSVNELVTKVESYFAQTAEEFEHKETFTMFLPPAISLQADVKLRQAVYLNLSAHYGLKVGNSFLYRPSVIALTPRFETARWEVSIPFSIYEWQYSMPRIGFSFRYGNVFFGFDRLNTIIGASDFVGLDFYAGLRLNLSNNFKMNFVKGNCGMRKVHNIETFDFRNF